MTRFRTYSAKFLNHPKQISRKGGGLRHINTCRKVPFFRRRHFALLSISLIFLRVATLCVVHVCDTTTHTHTHTQAPCHTANHIYHGSRLVFAVTASDGFQVSLFGWFSEFLNHRFSMPMHVQAVLKRRMLLLTGLMLTFKFTLQSLPKTQMKKVCALFDFHFKFASIFNVQFV